MEDARPLNWIVEPKYKVEGRFQKWVWFTRCGTFRIDRWISEQDNRGFFAVQTDRVVSLSRLNKGGVRINDIPIKERIWVNFNQKSSKVDYFPNLSLCITACESHSGRKSSNKYDVLEYAEDQGIDDINLKTRRQLKDEKITSAEYDYISPKVTSQTSQLESEVEVKEAQARKLFVAMGHLSAEDTSKWDLERLERNFTAEKLAKMVEPPKGREPADPEDLALLGSIVTALQAEEEIKVVASPKEKKVVPPKEPSANGTASKDESEKPKIVRGKDLPKDDWGYREGTGSSAVNAVLMNAKEGLTMKQITEKSGVPKDRVNHVRELMEKGLVKKEGDLYSKTGKTV